GAEAVDAPVVEDGQQPSADASPARRVRGGHARHAQEGILDEVLRALALAEQTERERIRDPGVAVVEHREGAGVPLLDEGEELLVREARGIPVSLVRRHDLLYGRRGPPVHPVGGRAAGDWYPGR